MKLLSLITLFIFVSCGKVVQDTVDSVAGQTKGMLSPNEYSTEEVEGLWEGFDVQSFANLPYFYEGAQYLQLDTFDRRSQEDLKTVNEKTKHCSLSESNQADIDEVRAKFFFEIKSNSYHYFAYTVITFIDGSETECKITVGKGSFNIIGSYLYLEDLKSSLFVSILSKDELYMGFTE